MKTAFILAFILLLLSFHSNAQQTIDKLNVNQLKLPKESANKALILDGAGQVKSSSTITDTELGYLEGLSDTLVNLLSGKANDSDVVKLSGNQSVDGIKTFTGKLVASSTVNGSIPCPVMTEAQRDLFTPVEGDCVYNSDTLKLNVFDGSVWKDVGGAGGISLWLTANPYNVNDIVIESDKIYRCLIAHTSGVFATDLGAGNWGEVSQGLTSPVALADGGTGLSITPVAGSIVYVDADSFEQLSPGSAGQILQSNGSSAPSWVNKSVSAKSENGSSVTAEELQVSNNQLTQVDTNKHLIESGNNNLLINPSFEHSTFSTGWTNSAGTFTEETVVEIHGKKAAKLVLSSQTMALTQDSSLYAAQFADGVQGLASVRVKSDVALKVCSRSAGVTSSSLCVDVQANNKWGLYKVPFILGATSNGISIASAGAVTGTVYIDDAFVGAASLTQNMNACNDVSCETEFSAKISGASVVSDENLDWITSCSSGGTGFKVCTFKTGLFTVAPNCQMVSGVASTSNFLTRISASSATSATFLTMNTNATPADGPFEILCQKQGADFTAAKQLSNGNTYSSTNADTDWASCNFSTLAWQGLGTVTNDLKCKRNGSDLLIRGRVTLGVTTASIAQIPLPLWNSSQLISSSNLSSTENAGNIFRNNTINGSTKNFSVLSIPSVSYFSIGVPETQNTISPLVATAGNSMFASSEIISVSARIPIEGWQNSNIIIGQFNGLESCSDTYQCTDVFSAQISATGTVIAGSENVDWISGNCTFGTNYSCTYLTNTLKGSGQGLNDGMNCTLTTDNSTTAVSARVISSTTSGVSFQGLTTAGAETSAQTRIVCQKRSSDYIGKTAKAVASDQNTRMPGILKNVITRVDYGGSTFGSSCTASPCSFYNQRGGSWITSMTRSALGDYTVTLNTSYWANITQTRCWITSGTVFWHAISVPNSSGVFSVGSRQNISGYAGADSVGTLYCEGEQQ